MNIHARDVIELLDAKHEQVDKLQGEVRYGEEMNASLRNRIALLESFLRENDLSTGDAVDAWRKKGYAT